MSAKHTPGWDVDRLHAALNGKATEQEARLIAAAPYLYAALVEAENALADYVPQLEAKGSMLGYGRSVLRNIRAAIMLVMLPTTHRESGA